MKTESKAVTAELLKKREKLGWYALGATALLGIILVASEAPEFLKASLFVPAFVSALGFLQAWFRFTIPMNFKEVYGIVKYEKGQKLAAAKQKHQAHARLLVVSSALIGVLIAASSFSS